VEVAAGEERRVKTSGPSVLPWWEAGEFEELDDEEGESGTGTGSKLAYNAIAIT
jgi:hypothetical protein